MSEYMVYFDFTTVHGGGKFIGRSGQLSLNSIEEVNIQTDMDELQARITEYIHAVKPKWNVFMINVKGIEPLQLPSSEK